MTGTPIQNRLTDLASLFRFLRVYPFDDPETFRQHVSRSWKTRADPQAIVKLRLLINSITLRRPKKAINLPHRTDKIHTLEFGPEERRHYDNVKAQTVEIDEVLPRLGPRSRLSALQSLSALRLICNHGMIESGPPSTNGAPELIWNLDSAQQVFEGLRDSGQAYCLHCNQDLSFMVSDGSDCGDTILSQPRVSEDLQLLCASCFEQRPRPLEGFLSVCNHFSRCNSQQSSGAGTPISPLPSHEFPSGSTGLPLSTKISSLIGSLADRPIDERRLTSSLFGM